VLVRRKTAALTAVLASLVVVLAACGSSSSGASSSPTSSSTSSAGTPQVGGTLNMVGASDVDYMDPNISYYSVGYTGLRMWSRQLYSYPAVVGQTTTVEPDLATAMPVVSDNGKTYTVTI
jgi:peptide/nickel transport system substrate-binding protein